METPEPTGGWVLVKAPAPRGRENSTLTCPLAGSPPPGLFHFSDHLSEDAALVKPASGAPAVEARRCWNLSAVEAPHAPSTARLSDDAQHAWLGLMLGWGTARRRRVLRSRPDASQGST
jgi:hypothetical protein